MPVSQLTGIFLWYINLAGHAKSQQREKEFHLEDGRPVLSATNKNLSKYNLCRQSLRWPMQPDSSIYNTFLKSVESRSPRKCAVK
jgi:hypothetical protein